MNQEKDTVIEIKEDRYKNNCFATVNYYINEKKKVIACRIEPDVEKDYSSLTALFNPGHKGLGYKESMERSFFEMCGEQNISFVGKAICMDDDEFNVEFGKNLAYDKAMFKLLAAKSKFILNDVKELKGYIDADTAILEDISKQVDKVTERFEKKLKEVM
jgi:hypothetical protein